MHHGRRRHRRHGFGSSGYGRPGFGRFNRETMLEQLEEHQRDLEQELADVSDLIKRLQDERQPATATQI
jgi:hypothetical protein